jgi:hypothetical protein
MFVWIKWRSVVCFVWIQIECVFFSAIFIYLLSCYCVLCVLDFSHKMMNGIIGFVLLFLAF